MPSFGTLLPVRPGPVLFPVLLLTLALAGPAASVPASAQAAAPEPAIAFEPGAVVVTGAAPGADVVVHGVAREVHGYITRVASTRQVVPGDASGQARLEVPEGVAPASVWTAVDTSTGAFSISSPGDFAPEELAFPADGLGQDRSGAWRALRAAFERAEVLYVRPGVGGWWAVGVDGSGSDEDDADDSALAVSLELAQPLWNGEPPPAAFADGDVVVVVSLDTLDFFAARLAAPAPAL